MPRLMASMASEVMFEVRNPSKSTMPDNFATMQICSKIALNARISIFSQEEEEEQEEQQGRE